MAWQTDCRNFLQYDPEMYSPGLNPIVQYSQKTPRDFYIYFLKKIKKILTFTWLFGIMNTRSNDQIRKQRRNSANTLQSKVMEVKLC